MMMMMMMKTTMMMTLFFSGTGRWWSWEFFFSVRGTAGLFRKVDKVRKKVEKFRRIIVFYVSVQINLQTHPFHFL